MRRTVLSPVIGSVILLIILTLRSQAAQFSEKGKNGVLDYHNEIRSEVAHGNFVTKAETKRPSGGNMKKMTWNQSLANSADAFARKNPTNHSGSVGIGENIYWHWTTKQTDFNTFGVMAAISWIKEFKDIGWDTTVLTEELFRSGVGHATQMVWADTDQLGCAYSAVNQTHPIKKRKITKISVVCHYWPKGNFLNEPIYAEGESCSKCSSEKCDNGLCTV
uniref:SCP domain-containing protein n=1 Tax=Caenorhabditis japonica TaxID=281687 RepID=A0A8R1DH64_CAEJA